MNELRHNLYYLDKNTKPLSSHSSYELEILGYWLDQPFPLIVTRQPELNSCEQIQLAIPYFEVEQKKKIRLRYLFSTSSLIQSKELPTLHDIFPLLKSELPIIRVYGSYCWQYLTQLPYVQTTSDLDLLIDYSTQSLTELTRLYADVAHQLKLTKIDGEVRFPHFGDCSWLELIQTEASATMLVKSTFKLELLRRENLYAQFPTLLS